MKVLLFVTVDKFPLLSNGDLSGKAQLALDEASYFTYLLITYIIGVVSVYLCSVYISRDHSITFDARIHGP